MTAKQSNPYLFARPSGDASAAWFDSACPSRPGHFAFEIPRLLSRFGANTPP